MTDPVRVTFNKDGRVYLEFDQTVISFGVDSADGAEIELTPEQARTLAGSLHDAADELDPR